MKNSKHLQVGCITMLMAVAMVVMVPFAARGGTAYTPETKTVSSSVTACSLIITPDYLSTTKEGETFIVIVNNVSLCTWSVSSVPGWITVSPTSGNSAVTFVSIKIAPNIGPIRQAQLDFSGKNVGVHQNQGNCLYFFTPGSANVGADGAQQPLFVNVTASAVACPRSATTISGWIHVVSGNNLTGSGPIGYTVNANNSEARTGEIHLGNATFVVNQATGCKYTLDATSKHIASGGTPVTPAFVDVTATSITCFRKATSDSSWITIVTPQTITGSGPLLFNVAANQGPARSGKITVGNAVLTITQSEGCQFSLNPTSKDFGAVGGTGSLGVTATSALCPRNATSSANWLTITSGNNANGSGTINYAVAVNIGPARSAQIKVDAATFTVNQSAGTCSYTLSTSTFSALPVAAAAGFAVTPSLSQCQWSPVSSAAWLKITSPLQVTGTGAVAFAYELNPGAARSATITVGDKIATINQAANPCAFAINPTSKNFGANGGEITVSLTTSGASCPWSSVPGAPFISVVSGASGVGTGSTKLSVQPNNGPARSGSVAIAGQTLTVTQDGTNGQMMTLTGLSPGFTTKGGDELTVQVAGAGFTSSCRVRWNGSERPTTYLNSASLTVKIPASDISDQGVFPMNVVNVDTGAQTNAKAFAVYGVLANVSAASYVDDAVAPASIVAAFGEKLADATKVAAGGPLPTELEGTTVTVTDSVGKERQVQLFFVASGQINYLMPADMALGKATVIIKSGSGQTSVGGVEVRSVSPGLFTADSTGKGFASALVLRVKANGQQVYEEIVQYDQDSGKFLPKPIDIATPGEKVYLVLFGTGHRYRSSLSSVFVSLGGYGVDALYAGLAPGYEGLDQVNVPVPLILQGLGELGVQLIVDGYKANEVKVVVK